MADEEILSGDGVEGGDEWIAVCFIIVPYIKLCDLDCVHFVLEGSL